MSGRVVVGYEGGPTGHDALTFAGQWALASGDPLTVATVHPGPVYLHRGESYVVDSLDFEGGLAFVHAADPGYTTSAR